MSLTLIIGPMFSGKSKTMIRMIREKKRNDQVMVISHASDTRYSKDNIATHDGDLEPCLSCTTLLPLLASEEKYKAIQYIFIEESQFFEDLNEFVMKSISFGKDVFVAGLQSDYMMRPFQSILSLFSSADEIIQLRSSCMHDGCQSLASFSKLKLKLKLIDPSAINNDDNIGGREKYMATCRKHHSSFLHLGHM